MPVSVNVGDSVNFYFKLAADGRLLYRPAKVVQIYLDGAKRPFAADLEVAFTEEEQRVGGFSPTQAHKLYARGRTAQSGEWSVPQIHWPN